MKWSRQFVTSKALNGYHFAEDIEYDQTLIEKSTGILGIKDLKVEGDLHYYPSTDICEVELQVEGIMIVPCAITLEPVEYHFSDSEVYQFTFDKQKEDDEVILAKGNIIDIVALLWQLIVINIPLRVVKQGAKIDQVKGQDWEVISEDEREKTRIDPRLAALKNVKFDKN